MQDAAQEAFVRAWQRWAAVSTYVDPEAWVRLVACRIATSRWRSTRRGVSALRLLHAGQPRAEPPPAGTRIDVIAALRALPAAQRLVIVLHCLADMPLVEIAQQTDTPVGTIKARLSRGRKALAQRLGLDGITEQEDAHA